MSRTGAPAPKPNFWIGLAHYRGARFLVETRGGRGALGVLDKAARTKPLVFAAGAGLMQIRSREAGVSSCVETARRIRQSTAGAEELLSAEKYRWEKSRGSWKKSLVL